MRALKRPCGTLIPAPSPTRGEGRHGERREYAYNEIGNLTRFTLDVAGGGPWAGHLTRGAVGPGGGLLSGESAQGPAAFNPMGSTLTTGGSASTRTQGVTAFVGGFTNGQGGGLVTEEDTIYTYGDGAGPHAVTALSDDSTFGYDANGNMTSRTQDGVTWAYSFDAENRLVEVDDGTTTTTYVYDGNGSRVKRIVDDGLTVTTTVYVAGMEIKLVGGTEESRTVYYGVGGAFRIIGGDDAGLYYRHSDHLGSTSVLSDASGVKVDGSEVVYAPFGEVRVGALSELTDFGFTGQRVDRSAGGLMYYGARYYLPGLRRFISADSVVPGAGNPQALNRYAYAFNSPINYIDPSGHVPLIDGLYSVAYATLNPTLLPEIPGGIIGTPEQILGFTPPTPDSELGQELQRQYNANNGGSNGDNADNTGKEGSDNGCRMQPCLLDQAQADRFNQWANYADIGSAAIDGAQSLVAIGEGLIGATGGAVGGGFLGGLGTAPAGAEGAAPGAVGGGLLAGYLAYEAASISLDLEFTGPDLAVDLAGNLFTLLSEVKGDRLGYDPRLEAVVIPVDLIQDGMFTIGGLLSIDSGVDFGIDAVELGTDYLQMTGKWSEMEIQIPLTKPWAITVGWTDKYWDYGD